MKCPSYKFLGLFAGLFCFAMNSHAQLVLLPVQSDSLANPNLDGPVRFDKNPQIVESQSSGLGFNVAVDDTVGADKFYIGKDSLAMYCKTAVVQGRKKKKEKRYCWIPEIPEAVQKPVKEISCTDDCPITEESWDREQKMKERKKDRRDPHEKDMDRERRTAFRVMLKAAPFMAAGALCHLDASCSE